jgi:hypothetical protein
MFGCVVLDWPNAGILIYDRVRLGVCQLQSWVGCDWPRRVVGMMRYSDKRAPWHRLRRALAFPFYLVALILSFASDLLGRVAAKIADE